jgi:hypothetical protein
MRNCSSIFQRLKLSPDECLEKYVKEHDIVDIDHPDGHRHNLQTIDEESNDFDDFDDGEGDEMNDDTFPDCEREDEILHPLKEEEIFCQPILKEIADDEGTTGDVCAPRQYPTSLNVDTGCEKKHVPSTKSVSHTYVTLNLREAWANGKVAHGDFPSSHHNAKEFKQFTQH